MSSFLYPSLLGLQPEVIRRYEWKTLTSDADSGVMTTVARRKYPIVRWEHNYEFLNRNASPDDLQEIIGLYNQLQGQFDTFLFTDPEFNMITVANMAQYGQFGTGDGSTTNFQLTAYFENVGGPGGAEIIQNLNGSPILYINRYGLNEIMAPGVRTNYLLQSQAFNTTWSTSNATVTANTNTAPDGTVTGDSLFETTATGTHYVQQGVTVPSATETFTFSVWIYPGLTRTWAQIIIQENTGGTAASAYVNLAGAGSVGTIATGSNWSNISATITQDVGNPWYRCTITATKTNAATSVTALIAAATANGTNSYTGNASDGLVLWGAQLEIGSATMYLPTTTSQVTQRDYTLSATALVTFTNPPVLSAQLLWTGSWYYRCRFEEDAIVWKKFMQNFWGATVKFRSVKL